MHGPVNGEIRIFSTNYVETTECVCVCTRTCKHGSVTQSCLNLCDPLDCSLPGSSVHGIFQAKILKWVVFHFPGDLADPGTEPTSPSLVGGFFTTEPPGKPSLLLNKSNLCSKTVEIMKENRRRAPRLQQQVCAQDVLKRSLKYGILAN